MNTEFTFFGNGRSIEVNSEVVANGDGIVGTRYSVRVMDIRRGRWPIRRYHPYWTSVLRLERYANDYSAHLLVRA